jgi:enamine deaminase RidA (YjgF/YER057c/UK114 family)
MIPVTDDQTPEQRLAALGFTLPQPMNLGSLPFKLVRIDGTRALVSGHLPLADNGTIAPPLGKVGAELSPEQGHAAAARVALGMLASLKQELGELSRVRAWLKLFGMVNVAPGFTALPGVINGASQLILDVFGPQRGAHARSAVGMAELPMGVPVEIEAEVSISS